MYGDGRSTGGIGSGYPKISDGVNMARNMYRVIMHIKSNQEIMEWAETADEAIDNVLGSLSSMGLDLMDWEVFSVKMVIDGAKNNDTL